MHKKRYKPYIEDFDAQKLLKELFSMRNPKSWKKLKISDILINLTRFYHKLKTRCCQKIQDLQMTLKIVFNHILILLIEIELKKTHGLESPSK